ncbi:hypothetical protein F4777DRAFT_573399 [Nemania sp. FL0916]|nr:hypothetical protein F4777DRAFT_573399 [Nemania sp. FL0916]
MSDNSNGNVSVALTTMWLLVAIVFVFLVLRVYIRVAVTSRNRFGLDDYYYIVSFVSFQYPTLHYNAATATDELQVSTGYGLGQDLAAIGSLETASRGILLGFISQTVLIVGIIASKLSVGYFLAKVDILGKLRIHILVPAFVFAVALTISTIVDWFQCQPIAFLWDRRLNGTCNIDTDPSAFIAGVLIVLVDLWNQLYWLLDQCCHGGRRKDEKFGGRNALAMHTIGGTPSAANKPGADAYGNYRNADRELGENIVTIQSHGVVRCGSSDNESQEHLQDGMANGQTSLDDMIEGVIFVRKVVEVQTEDQRLE